MWSGKLRRAGGKRVKEDSGFSGENEEHLLSTFCGPSGHAGFLPPWRDGNDALAARLALNIVFPQAVKPGSRVPFSWSR